MATTEHFYTGNNSTTSFAFTFPYLANSDVKVELDNVVKTENTSGQTDNDYTINNTNIVFNTAPGTGVAIHIYRTTNVDTAQATFAAGSSIRAADLNNNQTQSLYSAQEVAGQKVRQSDLKDSIVGTTHIINDAVTGAKIAADAIDSEHYAATSIDTEHIANENVTTAKLANDAVTSAKLADNAVLTANITDANVTHVKLANDAVDGDNIANDSINSEHYVDGSIDTAHIADSQVTTAKIADSNVTTAKIANDAVTADKIADAVIVTNSEQAAASVNDTSFFTTSASDARYFNVSTGDTIKDGQTFPDNDTTIATTAAINDRIIDLVDDVGGFVPIANETSFPNANPDVNNGTGTIVSVSTLASNHTSNGSGVITISNGTVGNSTVTINGAANNTTYSAGYGLLVETTTTLNTYTFHRLVPKATEVTTVAGISGNVTTVAGISSNVTTVAGISSNVTTVAGNNSNVTTVAGNNSNITAVADNETNINAVKNNATNINTVAGANSNITTVAGSIANVNTTASNIANVNNFSNTYQIASSNPSTDGGGNSLAEGDLYFNTTANELKVYNGSTWQGGVTATGNLAGLGANTFTGNQTLQSTNPKLLLTDTNANSDYSVHVDGGVFYVRDETNTTNRLEIQSDGTVDIIGNLDAQGGLDVTGNITVSGNVDGRDVAADGTKLDGIEAGATADQTAAEIRTLVESASDSNVFTDADHTKLNGVATSATANPNAIDNIVEDTSPQLGGDLDTNSHNINLDDAHNVNFGDSSDLKIYHSGSHSYIKHTGTGNFYIDVNTDDYFQVTGGESETLISAQYNGAVELFHNGTKKFETTAGGVTITGTDASDGTIILGDLRLHKEGDTSATKIKWDGSEGTDGHLEIFDDVKLTFGDSSDLSIYHDGTDSYIVDSGTGDLMIRCSDDLKLQNADGSETFLHCNDGGDVILYRAGTERLRTNSGGVAITGRLDCTQGIDIDANNQAFRVGASQNLQLVYTGSAAEIKNIDAATPIKIKVKDGNEDAIVCHANGSVDLYHNDSKKFETSATGIKLNGPAHSDLSTLSDGATITVDFPTASHYTVTLGGNRTFGDPDNTGSAIGSSGSIFIVQDGTGSRTASFHGDYKFAGGTAPTLSTAANAVDRLDYVIRAANDVHCVVTLDVK